jgi:hypothetical protein
MRILSLLAVPVLLISGCTVKHTGIKGPGNPANRYTGDINESSSVRNPGAVVGSVRKLFRIDYYTAFHFPLSARVTADMISDGSFRRYVLGSVSSHETTSGTATVLFNSDRHIALLTCAHVVDSPDTISSFYPPAPDDHFPYCKSLVIKIKEQIFVGGLASCDEFDILAIDRSADIAIIGKRCLGNTEPLPAVAFPAGRSEDLFWGCEVYILGYPLGNLLLTRGTVSLIQGRSEEAFTVDALLNKGYSGGPILAVNNTTHDYEMVGMVKSMSSQVSNYIRPEKEISEFRYNEAIPYTGDFYVGTSEVVSFGVNNVVSIGVIRDFYKKNREPLICQGYDLDMFFNTGQTTR